MDILERVLNLVERHAGRPFLIEASSDRIFTYGETHQLASNLAAELSVRGIRRGDRVGLVLRNSAEFALLYFACLYLGAVAVPVNPALHKGEIEFILAHSGVKLTIYSPTTRKILDGLGQGMPLWQVLPWAERDQAGSELIDTWSLGMPMAAWAEGWRPFAGVGADDLFSITFTSGTTSLPKGVAHRISALFENATAFNEELGFGPENCFLHVFHMAYMAGFLNTLLCPFMAGSSVVLARPFDAQGVLYFWDTAIRYGVDAFWMAPTMLETLLRVDRSTAGLEYCRKHVKRICVGTAPLPVKTKKDFELKYGVELFESYGLSELLLVSTNSSRTPRLDGSVGRVLPGVEVQVVNEQGESVPQSEDGEIWIETPFIMAGYLSYQTLQPEPINAHDWFPTGDIGRVNREGHLFITGRKKDLIIRGGINISPRAVEEVLLEHEAVAQAAVIGLPHDFYGEEVVAVVKLKDGYPWEAAQPSIAILCSGKLSPVAVPTKFFELDYLPTSTIGKVQKEKLRELLGVRLGLKRDGGWRI